MPRTVKTYCHNGLSGCVQQTVARETGTLVGVCHAEQAGLDNDPATPWFTVCEAHHYLVGHPSLRLAKYHAVTPSDWCEYCRRITATEPPKIMTLPDIAIPYAASRGANQDRYGTPGDGSRCLLCARPVNLEKIKTVALTSDLGDITDPAVEVRGEEYGGRFYIGSDCWRNHPELHAYEVKP